MRTTELQSKAHLTTKISNEKMETPLCPCYYGLVQNKITDTMSIACPFY